ncbi:serine/threonine-protein kinase [Streptosporangium vulgare]|uniref:serine/threonine-protein kinase n=1 Tax=Streptosporangium vulgare TaxID=46190 RepID=UPI0031E151C4
MTAIGWTPPGYTELRELGAGGGGRVVLARHDESGTQVAIKYLAEWLRDDPGFLARFREEARLLVELADENVTRLYEYVEVPGGAAIVMEAVNGVSLRALLREHGPTGPEAALAVLKGSLSGLATAHRTGLVHRDYKPENVLVEATGTSKLVDFGIAVRTGGGGRAAGTPPYMAPEQWAGAPASPASDVYAATAVFFECLAGHRPYPSGERVVLMHQHMTAPIPVDEVPEPVRPLVARGLAKRPGDRPATAAEFLAELESVAVAGYGREWEERGRAGLAALVALLPLLFPSGGPGPVAGTTLFRTVLGTLRSRSAGGGGGRRGGDADRGRRRRVRPRLGRTRAASRDRRGRRDAAPAALPRYAEPGAAVPARALSRGLLPSRVRGTHLAHRSRRGADRLLRGTGPVLRSHRGEHPLRRRDDRSPRHRHARTDTPGITGIPADADATVLPSDADDRSLHRAAGGGGSPGGGGAGRCRRAGRGPGGGLGRHGERPEGTPARGLPRRPGRAEDGRAAVGRDELLAYGQVRFPPGGVRGRLERGGDRPSLGPYERRER